jgi:hypothetical protein
VHTSIVCTVILQPLLGHYLVNPKPFLGYLPSTVRRQTFIIISFVKKCTLYLKKFGTWFVVGVLRFKKWFDVDILDFQFELWYWYFRHFFSFQFRVFLGYFLKNWTIFVPILLVTLNKSVEAQFLSQLVMLHLQLWQTVSCLAWASSQRCQKKSLYHWNLVDPLALVRFGDFQEPW